MILGDFERSELQGLCNLSRKRNANRDTTRSRWSDPTKVLQLGHSLALLLARCGMSFEDCIHTTGQ